jgi:hypothetical protein
MNDAQRPDWTARGVVEAPADQVAGTLLDVRTGVAGDGNALVLTAGELAQSGPVVLRGGPRTFTADIGEEHGTSVRVEVDPDRRSLTIEGHWWYRGVYTVEPHERGSLITYRVYNIAPGFTRWMATLLNLRQAGKTAEDLRQVLRAIGARLGAGTHLVDEPP